LGARPQLNSSALRQLRNYGRAKAMALTNAEKQKRWREKRNGLAEVLTRRKPEEVADGILHELGVERAKKVARALGRRLRNLKPDCPSCCGTGVFRVGMETARGSPISFSPTVACDCGPIAAAFT
jgi:hypothetical protein